jgi:hypothetical protein
MAETASTPARAGGDHVDIGSPGEHLNQTFARQRLVFHHDGTNAHLGRA